MKKFFKQKKVVIFGGGSFIASRMIDNLIEADIAKICLIDNSEERLFAVSMNCQRLIKDGRMLLLNADVVDAQRYIPKFRNFDYAFFLAASKHVEYSELSPFNCSRVNIQGVQASLEACVIAHVKKFVFVSSDKAVYPTNVMGASKLIAERLVSAFNSDDMTTSSVRFGNVVGSPGSLLPILVKKARLNLPFVLRGTDVTRFFMSSSEAARLTLAACKLACGGETFVLKMQAVSVPRFVRAASSNIGTEIDTESSPLQFGEKSSEELISSSELPFTRILDDMYVLDILGNRSEPLLDGSILKTLDSYSATEMNDDDLNELIKDGIKDCE